MKYIKFTLFLFLLWGFITLQAQNITNITPMLDDNTMQIKYTITDAAFNQKFTAALYVSIDGGNTWQGPMTLIQEDKKEVTEGENTIFCRSIGFKYRLHYP